MGDESPNAQMHHSQPLKIKFGINHFLEFWTLVLLWYRECVNTYILTYIHLWHHALEGGM